ncbi:MAG: PAS domain S-box protein [bacterium]|nr:PAS domain S-box protein [bacterium]
METLIIIGADSAERRRLEEVLSSADWRCLVADASEKALTFEGLPEVLVGFVQNEVASNDLMKIADCAPNMNFVLYGDAPSASSLLSTLGDRIAGHIQAGVPAWSIDLTARRAHERARAIRKSGAAIVEQSYRNLFHASAELSSAESLQLLLSLLCSEIAQHTGYRRAVLVLGDARFRIQDIAVYANDPSSLPDLATMRGRPLTPVIPGRILTERGRGFVEQQSDAAPDSMPLIVPLERSDGTIAGFLTLDEPLEAEMPLAELSEPISLLLRHGIQAVEIQSMRGQLRKQFESTEQLTGARSLELRQAQERFSRLVNLTDDVIYLCDDLGRIVYLNEAFAQNLGYTRENVLGKSLPEALMDIAVDSAGNMALLEQIASRSNERIAGDIELFAKDGNRRSYKLLHNWIRQGDDIVAAQGVLRDASERQELLLRLASSERVALSGRLASGIAHEINNPLQAISAHLTGLVELVGKDERAAQSISIVAESVERIRVIVRSLLDLHRIEPAPRSPTQLNDIVARTNTLLEPQMRQSGVVVEARMASDLPRVMAAATELEQVLINLMLNASQAMSGGGRIVLETAFTETRVEIRVRDNGPGIAPEIQKRLFEPFVTFREQGGGTGLGLYVSKFLITQHGGELHFESEPGAGTTFVISLPR